MVDHLKVPLPVGHYINYRQKGIWSVGSICSIDGHLHKIEEHTGDNPCACNIHLVVIAAPPTE